MEGVECISGLVDQALDVFICSSIFVDDAAQVDKLLHLAQVLVMECDGVLFLVVYSHHPVFLVLILSPVFSASWAGQLLLCVPVSV